LLNLPQAFGQDLAGFEGDKPAKFLLRSSELVTEKTYELAASWSRYTSPHLKGLLGETNGALRFIRCGRTNMRNDLACNRRAGGQAIVCKQCAGNSKPLANFEGFLVWRWEFIFLHCHRTPRGFVLRKSKRQQRLGAILRGREKYVRLR